MSPRLRGGEQREAKVRSRVGKLSSCGSQGHAVAIKVLKNLRENKIMDEESRQAKVGVQRQARVKTAEEEAEIRWGSSPSHALLAPSNSAR